MGVGAPLPESEGIAGPLAVLPDHNPAVVHVVSEGTTRPRNGQQGEVCILQGETEWSRVTESRARDQPGIIDACQQRLGNAFRREIHDGEVGPAENETARKVEFADDRSGRIESPWLQVG